MACRGHRFRQLHALRGDYTQATALHERMLAPAFVALTRPSMVVCCWTATAPAVRLLREAEVFARDAGVQGILQRAATAG